MIHVGDYIYREDPCPAGDEGCAGSPYGDNWPTWEADFFEPAGAALGPDGRGDGWALAVRRADGTATARCRLVKRTLDCA